MAISDRDTFPNRHCRKYCW